MNITTKRITDIETNDHVYYNAYNIIYSYNIKTTGITKTTRNPLPLSSVKVQIEDFNNVLVYRYDIKINKYTYCIFINELAHFFTCDFDVFINSHVNSFNKIKTTEELKALLSWIAL